MKIGVFAQRFGIPLEEALSLAATTGVDGVQLYSVSPRENLFEYSPAKKKELKQRCADLNLEIFSICGEVGGFGFRLKEENPAKIGRIKRNMDLALELGCNIVTSHIGVIQSSPSPLRDAQKKALLEIGSHAVKNGAVFAIETGPERGEILRDFLDELSPEGVKVNLDAGNMAMVTGEDPAITAELLAPYVFHTHLKDGCHYHDCEPEKVYAAFATGGIKQLFAENGTAFIEKPIGSGDIDWEKYLKTLFRLGLNKYPAVIEREISPKSGVEARQTVAFLRKIIANIRGNA